MVGLKTFVSKEQAPEPAERVMTSLYFLRVGAVKNSVRGGRTVVKFTDLC